MLTLVQAFVAILMTLLCMDLPTVGYVVKKDDSNWIKLHNEINSVDKMK